MESEEITAEIDHIVEQIVRKYNPLKIILFGSAATELVNGNETPPLRI